MATKIIHAQWEGPFPLTEANRFSDEARDYGVYQFYGPHVVYGKNALLYIGKASRQTLAKRISQEKWEYWESAQGQYHFHIGRLAGSMTPTKPEWNRQIDLVETLLIVSHSPALNRTGVESLTEAADREAKNLHVLNWGECGALLPEVSGLRWSSRFDDPPRYASYGNHECKRLRER